MLVGGERVRHRTETVYDERGRTEKQRANLLQLADGTLDDSDVQETRYQYDELGRAYKTVYTDGSFTQVRFDASGQTVAESQQVAAGTALQWSEETKSCRQF